MRHSTSHLTSRRPAGGRTPLSVRAARDWAWYTRGQFLLSWRVFWRNRRSMTIGFALPVVLDLVVAAPLRGREIGGLNAAGYTGVGFVGLAMATSFVHLLTAVVARREELILKRLRGTQVPPSAILAGQLGVGAAVLMLQALVLGGVAVLWFHAPPPAHPVLFLLALALGCLVFCALALALSGPTPGTEAAPMVALPVLLLCMFGAGVFTPVSSLPALLRAPARVLPLEQVVRCLRTAWFGRSFGGETWNGAPLPRLDLLHTWAAAAPGLLTAAAWAAAALMLTRRSFRWEPRRA
ncbi:ABC transporter permease [Streptomyces sp. NPDC051976]|uniref:ABC transporter permease n=1 Tax=Streptomyces sp. NPDC051976 TaxID=3154947 RepID=UPI0034123D08